MLLSVLNFIVMSELIYYLNLYRCRNIDVVLNNINVTSIINIHGVHRLKLSFYAIKAYICSVKLYNGYIFI